MKYWCPVNLYERPYKRRVLGKRIEGVASDGMPWKKNPPPWKKVPTAWKKVPTAACDFSFGARRFRRRDGGELTQALGLPFFTLCRKKGGAAGGWRFSLSHPMQKAERTPLRCLSAVLRAREGGCYALWGHGHRGRAVVQRGLISKLRSAGRSLPSQPSSCRWH